MAHDTRADLRLIAPCESYADSYVEALREGYRRGVQRARTAEEIAEIEADFVGTFTRSLIPPKSITTPDGSEFDPVPAMEFWAVEGKAFIGSISIRFALNDLLRRYGGHIGYGVRPSLQNRGYATRMTSLAKDLFRERGDTEILLTCSPHNVASRRVIEKAGGALLREEEPFGFGPTLLFRIKLV